MVDHFAIRPPRPWRAILDACVNAAMRRTAADPMAAPYPAAAPVARRSLMTVVAEIVDPNMAVRLLLGIFDTAEEAALRLRGARPRLNFPAAAFQLHFHRAPPRRLDYDVEAGGQAYREEEEEEEAKMLRDIFGQAYPALLAASAMSYSAFKDAPEHVKIILFGGLVIIYILLIAGMLSRSLARRQLAFRLVSCSAVTLLTFSVASQLSESTYVVLTALVGGLLNLVIMLLRL